MGIDGAWHVIPIPGMCSLNTSQPSLRRANGRNRDRGVPQIKSYCGSSAHWWTKRRLGKKRTKFRRRNCRKEICRQRHRDEDRRANSAPARAPMKFDRLLPLGASRNIDRGERARGVRAENPSGFNRMLRMPPGRIAASRDLQRVPRGRCRSRRGSRPTTHDPPRAIPTALGSGAHLRLPGPSACS
jgi:hypothetical protein